MLPVSRRVSIDRAERFIGWMEKDRGLIDLSERCDSPNAGVLARKQEPTNVYKNCARCRKCIRSKKVVFNGATLSVAYGWLGVVTSW